MTKRSHVVPEFLLRRFAEAPRADQPMIWQLDVRWRCEERIAFSVERPAAFCLLDLTRSRCRNRASGAGRDCSAGSRYSAARVRSRPSLPVRPPPATSASSSRMGFRRTLHQCRHTGSGWMTSHVRHAPGPVSS